jgi:hypothetical protein
MSRRNVVAALPALGLAACASTETAADPFAPERLEADLHRYAAFGIHRSGWPGDASAVDWLGGRLSQLGYEVHFDAQTQQSFSGVEAHAEVGGETIEVEAQWPPPPQLTRIEAPLVRADQRATLPGSVALSPTLAPAGAYWNATADAMLADLARAGARALIVCVDAPNDALFLYNRGLAPPLPVPVLIARKLALPALLEGASNGAQCVLTINAEPGTLTLRSVVARRRGVGRSIAVSTPFTGWFRCGAERGPGVALLLALAAHLQNRNAPVTLLATTGHEVGHLGMDRALQTLAPRPEATARWVHLGSSIATRAAPATTPRVFATGDLLSAATAAFSPLNLRVALAGAETPGETGTVAAEGYASVLGFAGGNPDFHTPLDDGRSIDMALLAAVGANIAALL